MPSPAAPGSADRTIAADVGFSRHPLSGSSPSFTAHPAGGGRHFASDYLEHQGRGAMAAATSLPLEPVVGEPQPHRRLSAYFVVRA